MKKIFMIMFVITCVSIFSINKSYAAYSDGSAIGATLSVGYPVSGIGVTAKFNGVPIVFGGNFGFYIGNNGYFTMALTADWWAFKYEFGKAGDADASMYLGPGGSISMLASSTFAMDFGIRMPVGFSFLVKEKWEIFLEPSIGLNIIGFSAGRGSGSLRILGSPTDNFGFGLSSFWLNFAFGFRYWM